MLPVQDSLSALEILRLELDDLTANASSGKGSQSSFESDWFRFQGEFGKGDALVQGLDGILASDDGLQITMDTLKDQISTLASAVKEYAEITNALQVSFMFF